MSFEACTLRLHPRIQVHCSTGDMQKGLKALLSSIAPGSLNRNWLYKSNEADVESTLLAPVASQPSNEILIEQMLKKILIR